ncbi:MAG: hypothetical protein F6K31_26300, partial [Symploca sp. SIO2G7]|nr:hypothetical protein [Symploca sp. SIO2G7]
DNRKIVLPLPQLPQLPQLHQLPQLPISASLDNDILGLTCHQWVLGV